MLYAGVGTCYYINCHTFIGRTRAHNTAEVHFNNISWQTDAIGFETGATKTNTHGESPEQEDIKHCYANPWKPWTCLFLALGSYLAVRPGTPTHDRLFTGKSPQKTFAEALGNAFADKEFTDMLDARGIAWRHIAIHSSRKGSSTFAASGSTNCPLITAICLRSGWSLGDLLKRYLRSAAAGDQFLGRVLAGLPQNSARFSVLPPQFNAQDSAAQTRVHETISRAFPQHKAYGSRMKPVLHYLAAALVHHRHWIDLNLDPTHPLKRIPLFKDDVFLSESAKIMYSFPLYPEFQEVPAIQTADPLPTDAVPTPVVNPSGQLFKPLHATGIPPHIYLLCVIRTQAIQGQVSAQHFRWVQGQVSAQH